MPQTRVQDWLDLDPGKRAPWFEHADMRASAALLLLEQAALRRQQMLSRDELKRRFFGHDAERHADGADPLIALQNLVRLEAYLSRPAAMLPDTGYGLPQAAEREMLAQESNQFASKWRAQSAWLQKRGSPNGCRRSGWDALDTTENERRRARRAAASPASGAGRLGS
jgi:hypothetical protein